MYMVKFLLLSVIKITDKKVNGHLCKCIFA